MNDRRDTKDHTLVAARCTAALSERGWRHVSTVPEGPGEVSVLFHREPSRTGLTPELLIVQIADEISPALALSRTQIMSERSIVGVVTIVSDRNAAPLAADLGHDDLVDDNGPRRLLDIVERTEMFAAGRARMRQGDA